MWMAADTLDRLLNALAVRLHAYSVCEVQQGWRLASPAFEATTLHFVLKGSGALRVGNGPWLPFAPRTALVVPARQPFDVGEPASTARVARLETHCSLLADGLVRFTAGDGQDTLMLCGAISAAFGSALGLFDLMLQPMIEDFSASSILCQVFDLMLAEVSDPGIGTQAMAEVLMKHCLITLLRQHLGRDGADSPLLAMLHYPRLARAVLAIIEQPAAPHSVENLAELAGMSRSSFAGHFSRASSRGRLISCRRCGCVSPPDSW